MKKQKDLWVCPCSWVWICLGCVCVCVRQQCGECVLVSVAEKQEEGTVAQWSVSHTAGLPWPRGEDLS